MDANKPPEPPPKNPLLDSFAKGNGFMPPAPTRPPAALFNSVRAVKGKLLRCWSVSASGHLDRICFRKGRTSTLSRTKLL
eukprot:122879-Pleurochrysis_carterae.AAC.1